MGSSPVTQPGKNSVALVRWSTTPGENPVVKFLIFSVFSLILCLFLMIFLRGVASFGAVTFFTVFFAVLLTLPTVQRRRTFLRGLTKRVNDTIVEVTSTPGDQLSVREFRRMVRSGERLPLLVSGVPGLNLHVERLATLEQEGQQRWVAVFSVAPPENGTESFDRLVAAVMGAGPATSTA
ncbi:MAG: hypothetical protein ABWX85_12405 [Arthrobacter sp.]